MGGADGLGGVGRRATRELGQEPLVASLLLVVRPGAPSNLGDSFQAKTRHGL